MLTSVLVIRSALVLHLYKMFPKYFAMIFDCFFLFEVSLSFVLIINFSLGANRLIFLTASYIFIVSFLFLSRSSKPYLILFFFSFLITLWIWVIILFLSFFSNYFFLVITGACWFLCVRPFDLDSCYNWFTIRLCEVAIEGSWVKYFKVHIFSLQNLVYLISICIFTWKSRR